MVVATVAVTRATRYLPACAEVKVNALGADAVNVDNAVAAQPDRFAPAAIGLSHWKIEIEYFELSVIAG
jgi:hypothetical protein